MEIGKIQRPGSLASQAHHQSAFSSSQSSRTRQGSRHSSKRKSKNAELDLERPCKEHSFITDVNDVRNMQEGLLKLLDDFDSGKIQAFDAHCSFEKMDNIRDLQEKLARTHFQMDTQLRAKGGNTKEAMELASSNMDHLLSNLDQLSIAIRSLHPPRDDEEVFLSQPRM